MEAEKTPPIFKQLLLLGILAAAGFIAHFIIESSYNEWAGSLMSYTNYVMPFAGAGAIVVLAIIGIGKATKNGSMARVLGIIILVAAILVAVVGGNIAFLQAWNAVAMINTMGFYLDASYPTDVFYKVMLLHVAIVAVIIALVTMKQALLVMKLTAGYKKAPAK